MRAALRRLHSPDVVDLRLWDPAGKPAAIHVQLMVGPDPGHGEESFDVTLCTAAWLEQRAGLEGIVDAGHHYVVHEYDYERLADYFSRRISRCEGPTWAAVAEQVARIGAWEFEDYRPFPDSDASPFASLGPILS